MGMENDAMLDFLRDNRRFADLFNGGLLYHGTEPWDGPRTLREMMEFGNEKEKVFWEKKFSDYQMQLVCVNELEDITRFTTELKELFGIMAYRKDKQGMNQFLEQHEEYKRLG